MVGDGINDVPPLITISPETAAIAMSGSSLLVAANALRLKRTRISRLK